MKQNGNIVCYKVYHLKEVALNKLTTYKKALGKIEHDREPA